MPIQKTVYLAIAVIIIVVIAGVAAYFMAGPPAGEKVIKIGAVGPLSAPGASIQGVELKKGIEIAVDMINEQGGINGKKIELIFEDTQGIPEKDISRIRRGCKE